MHWETQVRGQGWGQARPWPPIPAAQRAWSLVVSCMAVAEVVLLGAAALAPAFAAGWLHYWQLARWHLKVCCTQRQAHHSYPPLPLPVSRSCCACAIGCPLWWQVVLAPPSHNARLHAHSRATHGHGHLPLLLRAAGHAVQAAGVRCPSSGTGELPGEGVPPVHPSPSSRRSLAAIPSAAVQAYSLRFLCPPTST